MKKKIQNQRTIIICAIAVVAIATTIIIFTTKKENNNQQIGQNDSYKVQRVEPPVKELPEEKDNITFIYRRK